MELIKEGSSYVLRNIGDKTVVAADAGFMWNAKQKNAWSTTSPFVAARLIRFADEFTALELRRYAREIERRLICSARKESEVVLAVPNGMSYMSYQAAGIEEAIRRRNFLLADEMGLGKTVEVAGIINNAKINKSLIVCPASLKINWQREMQKWLVRDMSIEIVTTSTKSLDADICIINYDILDKMIDVVLAYKWDAVIADEAHLIKNPKSARTKAFRQLDAKYKGLLTGTPMPNRAKEIQPLIAWLDPDIWGNWWHFVNKYAGAKRVHGRLDTNGSTNLGELNERLKQSVMIRRLKSDVMQELPDKIRQIIEIPCDNSSVLDIELGLWRKIEMEIEDFKSSARDAALLPTSEEYLVGLSKLRASMYMSFKDLSIARHATAMYKMPIVASHLVAASQEHKVVGFAHHRDVIEGLREIIGDSAVVLYGGMTTKAKQESVDRFEGDDNARVFIGSMRAAGVGLTLVSSSHVIFSELDWVPSVISQCEDRLHRKGQKNSVLCQHLVLHGSVDAMMARKLVDKQRRIDAAIDGKESGEQSILGV